jgi:hypothetical protein
MYAWMEKINLLNFRDHIEDFISQLADPALLIIPDDPVFVSYRTAQQIRLMSANSLSELAKQLEESRQFIKKARLDISEISLVIASNNADKPYELVFKDMLRALVEKGMNRAQIRITCYVIHTGAIEAFNTAKKSESLSTIIIDNFKKLLGEEKAPLIDDYLKVLNTPDKSSIAKLLPAYLEELITLQQVELDMHHKKLRDESGNDLTTEEIICPFTRQVINIERSRATQSCANQFLMLVVILAQLAKVESRDLEEFIASQNKDYVHNSTELLQQYVHNPQQLLFTDEQHQLLNQLGMSIVVQQGQAQKTLSANDVIEQESLSFPKSPQNGSLNNHLKGKSSRFFHLTLEEGKDANPYNHGRRNSI